MVLLAARVVPTSLALIAHTFAEPQARRRALAVWGGAAKLVAGAELKIYLGAPHGLIATQSDQFNRNLLAFIND